ncbi:2Fe-2S iron-sulfur cluster protein [Tumebacillus sp. BK434]|uniref:2Fe-2S iron-sulfur cluster-binding protein n=1 Tax=Tumebacillus sp. BK434 TaxID=2512169 RepID=UPI0010EFF03E|nr:2Fe-2S iron-sulfur cluster-binding protein [Tumebacillus sp. BK434]TCP54688.1 2Fe-2S iron-sulfur cluster protein [Tumebacillus sp. BK434]
MSKVKVLPHDKTVDVRDGVLFLAAVRAAKAVLPSKCGGNGACGTCKLQVESTKQLDPPTKTESRMLSARQIQDGYRLGCQAKVRGDAVVTLPEDPLRRVIRMQLEAARREERGE